jgi:hypothetical protein
MSGVDVGRMVKRRLRDAGLPVRLSPHPFRVTTITDLLEQGVPLEDGQSGRTPAPHVFPDGSIFIAPLVQSRPENIIGASSSPDRPLECSAMYNLMLSSLEQLPAYGLGRRSYLLIVLRCAYRWQALRRCP